ncbi:hypothetical protein C8R43DRAFT_1035416 [Mycena crocata]|nr:hypothetical protein C8R43DRAFT_1035416 [Mycena crocata]
MAMEVLFALLTTIAAVHVAAIATARSVLLLPCCCARSSLSEWSGSRVSVGGGGGADCPIPISVVFRCSWAAPAMSAIVSSDSKRAQKSFVRASRSRDRDRERD